MDRNILQVYCYEYDRCKLVAPADFNDLAKSIAYVAIYRLVPNTNDSNSLHAKIPPVSALQLIQEGFSFYNDSLGIRFQ